jgi:Fe2+ transport system protein FeoA
MISRSGLLLPFGSDLSNEWPAQKPLKFRIQAGPDYGRQWDLLLLGMGMVRGKRIVGMHRELTTPAIVSIKRTCGLLDWAINLRIHWS